MTVTETEVVDGIAITYLSDEPKRNALSEAMLAELHQLIDRKDVSAFILAGKGKVFCAGADVSELASGHWLMPATNNPELLFERIAGDRRPWVAALTGPAYGGGVELALSCDYVFATEGSSLHLPEATLGVVPTTAVKLLHGHAGRHLLMQWLVHPGRLTADEALRAGILTGVLPREALMDACLSFVQALQARVSPTAFKVIKQALHRPSDLSWREALALSSELDAGEVAELISAMLTKAPRGQHERWGRIG